MARASEERWAMVTGSSSGIGAATAIALAKAGWNVGVHYARSKAGAERVAGEIKQAGRKAFVVSADLSDRRSTTTFVERAWSKTGGLEAWVHLAGADVLTGANAKLSFEQKLDLLTKVDLWGTIRTTREVGRRMSGAGRGAIVTVGWDQADSGMEGDTPELFAAVKGGIMAFTRSLSKSVAPDVRVNCVAPGWIRTAWGERASDPWQERVLRETPLRRWGEPADVANAVVYLVSDAASFLTGQTLFVNGGVVTT